MPSFVIFVLSVLVLSALTIAGIALYLGLGNFVTGVQWRRALRERREAAACAAAKPVYGVRLS